MKWNIVRNINNITSTTVTTQKRKLIFLKKARKYSMWGFVKYLERLYFSHNLKKKPSWSSISNWETGVKDEDYSFFYKRPVSYLALMD